jgi:hypothetical protein
MFAWGWPTLWQQAASPAAPYIYLYADSEYVVSVTEASLQVWAGGAARVRLGAAHLSTADVTAFGTHIAAVWCPERAQLAALVRRADVGRGGAAPGGGGGAQRPRRAASRSAWRRASCMAPPPAADALHR